MSDRLKAPCPFFLISLDSPIIPGVDVVPCEFFAGPIVAQIFRHVFNIMKLKHSKRVAKLAKTGRVFEKPDPGWVFDGFFLKRYPLPNKTQLNPGFWWEFEKNVKKSLKTNYFALLSFLIFWRERDILT